MLYVPLDFENNLTVDALVDSGAIVSAITQNDLNTMKQTAPNIILKIHDPLKFHIQVANGQLKNHQQQPHLNFKLEIIPSLNTSP